MEEKDQERNYDEENSSQEHKQSDEEFGLPDVSSEPVRRQPPVEEAQDRYDRNKSKSNGSSSTAVIIGIILLVVVAGLAGYYFGIYLPQQEALTEEGTNTYIVEEPTPTEEPQFIEPEPVVETPIEPTEGTISTINSRTGRSYVIVGSFFDGDLAMDYGKKLASQGINSTIIEPYNNKHFYRLSVQDFDNMSDALASAESLKSQFGDQIWVLKY